MYSYTKIQKYIKTVSLVCILLILLLAVSCKDAGNDSGNIPQNEFLIYSANGCWSDHYALGVFEYMGGDMCSQKSWKKHTEPLLSYGNGVYGPGHASFFLSPDGTEVWCAYHGMRYSNQTVTYAPRYCHLQKIEFDENGYIIMGKPIGYVKLIAPPSGEIK